ncbi:MAG: hypothetical protein CMJ40_01215 [Phycisphaerae bacterium]|nr:hypothetical protein [Phycisphaerae bacterium]
MTRLVAFYRKLQEIQERTWVRVALTLVCTGLCIGYLAPIISFSYTADANQRAVFEALSADDAETTHQTLLLTGEIRANGRVFTVDESYFPEIFDENQVLVNPQLVVYLAIRPDVDSMLEWAPRWLLMQPSTTWTVGIVAIAWIWLIIWIGLFVPFMLTLILTMVPSFISGLLGYEELQFAIAGIGLLTFTFLLLIRLMLLILSWPNAIFSVATTLIREASRTRLTLLFIVIILAMLPFLPMTLDSDSMLRYQLQNFMSRSLEYTFALAACMTLLLACGTVAFEIRDRHIWHVMSKPVGHFQYLIGKWLGIVVLNMCLLAVAGVSVFFYIQYLRTTSTATGLAAEEDRYIIAEELLAARAYKRPDLELPDGLDLDMQVERIIENDSAFSTWQDRGVLPEMRQKIRRDLVSAYELKQRSVPYFRNGQPGATTFRFTGLESARNSPTPLSLSYQFIIGRLDEHERYVAGFMFNDDIESILLREYIPTVIQIVRIPSSFIQPDGSLEITVLNYFEPPEGRAYGQLFFEKGRFEILYRVGGFDLNFLRVMIILLVKLGVLAALGVFFATFLNFPVACLSAFTVFVGGQMAPFLADSLTMYFPEDVDEVDWQNLGQVIKWGFESTVRGLAKAMVFMLGAFGEYHPVADLVEGRFVSWRSVLSSFIRLELIWGGLSLVLGWLVLRSRQLAIYSGGQG